MSEQMGGINFGPMPGWSWDQTFNYLRDNLIATNRILMDPNCNDCHNPDCEWKPKPGESVRINCPHWMGEAIGVNNNAGVEN